MAALDDDEILVHGEIESLGDVENMTFGQLIMKRALLGLDPIPEKENFKGWGVGYLCQLLGFVLRENDSEFTRQFFSFLKSNRSLFKKNSDKTEFGNICYYSFIENMTNNRDYCKQLASFMIFEFKDEEWFDQFLQLSSTFVLLDMDALEEYYRIRYNRCIEAEMEEFINNGKNKAD